MYSHHSDHPTTSFSSGFSQPIQPIPSSYNNQQPSNSIFLEPLGPFPPTASRVDFIESHNINPTSNPPNAILNQILRELKNLK